MPAELDQHSPEMDQPMAEPSPEMGAPSGEVIGAHGQADREGAMAKADLYKLANYSHKLYQQINDEDQMEAWVQAKITKAADYIASVYHYLEYEMKFSEYGHHLDNSDTLSEGQKMKIKELLAEAKDKMKDLKKSQAEKMKGKHEHKVEEGFSREQPCTECGGTGVISMPVPEATKNKVEKYKTLVKATKAAHKRMDNNHNGVPDDEEVNELRAEYDGGSTELPEEFDEKSKVGDTFKTRTGVATKTDKGVKHTNTSHSDEEHGEPPSKVKSKSAAEKKADKANDIKLPKHSGNSWGMKNGEKFGKKVNEAAKLKGKQHKLDVDHDGDIEADDLADLRAGKKEKKVDESKPSAGLSKEKKSEVVKKAKAGGDIGKPGKSFEKTAKAAGGGEKGKKIAAAAMWKNIKETTAYVAEKAEVEKKAKKDYDGDGKVESGKDEYMGSRDKAIKAAMGKKETVKESTEFTRMQEQLARLTRTEKPALVENREVDQIRALTKRLLG